VRNSVISAEFGQNRATDILNASYYVPDTLYLILVGGGMSTAFIPILSRYLARGQEEEGWRVSSIAYNLVLVGISAVVALAVVFTSPLVHLVVPGFHRQALRDTVLLTRIMFLSILFHCLSAVLMGVEYAYQSFAGTAMGPLLYNLTIVGVGLALVHRLPHGPGTIDLRVEAFAISTAVGSFLNFLTQVWGVARLRPRYALSWDVGHEGIRRLVRLSIPVMIGLSFVQLNFFINQTLLASYLPPGSINALTLASRVMLIPVMVAISVGIALLPSLSQVAQARDWNRYRQLFSESLATVLFLAVPSSLGLMAVARPVVAVLFQHGAFTAQDTRITALALMGYAVGVSGYAAYEIVSRGFYALEDTRTPLVASAVNLLLSAGLNYLGVRLLGLLGLALAYSVTGFTNVAMLLWLLRRRVRRPLGLSSVAHRFARTLVAASVMAAAARAAAALTRPWGDAASLLAGLLVGTGSFAALSLGLGIPEARHTLRLVQGRLAAWTGSR
jgi:putative peptidoglycan lipid II flippase